MPSSPWVEDPFLRAPALRAESLRLRSVLPDGMCWDTRPGGLLPLLGLNAIFVCFPWQYTLNGKKVEVAVKQVIAGKAVEHRGAFLNPETLDLYQHIPELQGF